MSIQRKQRYFCHFCHREISPELIRTRSVSRHCSSWMLVRGGVRRKHMGVKMDSQYAHNSCVEQAFTKGGVVGQLEAWPSV